MAFNPNRLKDLRNAKPGDCPLSVEKLQELSEVSHSAISKAENGRSVPSGDNLAKIADALDAPMNYFYEEGNDPDPRRSAAEMAYQVFSNDDEFTVQQRQRCAPALNHPVAPRTATAWREFCQMVELVLGPPGSQGLELVRAKRVKRQ